MHKTLLLSAALFLSPFFSPAPALDLRDAYPKPLAATKAGSKKDPRSIDPVQDMVSADSCGSIKRSLVRKFKAVRKEHRRKAKLARKFFNPMVTVYRLLGL